PLSISDFFLSSRRRHTRSKRDWSSDVCSSDLLFALTLCNGKEISPEHLGLSSHTPALMQPTLPLRPPEQPLADFLEDIERQEIRSEERRVGKECRKRWWWKNRRIEDKKQYRNQ